MIEIRWHGRAGQGSKTASQLLALGLMRSGASVQAFPEYGPERSGAPMRAYTRVDDRPIRRRYGITRPDVVAVLDPSILGEVDVAEGLAADRILLVNSELPPAELRSELGHPGARSLPADALAEATGAGYVNVVMAGAVAAAIEQPRLEVLLSAAWELFGPRLTKERCDEVEAAISAGHRSVSEEVPCPA
jgi:pyruvate ferredoxin oxidoreductase gamma subunit